MAEPGISELVQRAASSQCERLRAGPPDCAVDPDRQSRHTAQSRPFVSVIAREGTGCGLNHGQRGDLDGKRGSTLQLPFRQRAPYLRGSGGLPHLFLQPSDRPRARQRIRGLSVIREVYPKVTQVSPGLAVGVGKTQQTQHFQFSIKRTLIFAMLQPFGFLVV